MFSLQFLETGGELGAAGHDVFEEGRLLHDLDRRQRRRATHRVAAIGPAVTAGGPLVVKLASRAEGGEGKSARDALGHANDVGLDAGVLDREHLAGATETALHLVGDEQDAVLLATLD